jgi:hypothetical protein
MILTSCHSASRLVAARRRRVATEADADGLHAVRTDGTAAGRDTAGSLDQDPPPAGQVLLAPRLAACGKIAMGIAMGYMLILML